MKNKLHVNTQRIERSLKKLSSFGKCKNGGINRSFGSSTDIQAREWIKSLWRRDLQLPVKVDAIANIWTRLEGRENLPPIVLGSHHDCVKNGGMYDGTLGIMLATEVLQKIKEENYNLRHPIAAVSFSGEEPNQFNISTLGSRTITGKLKKRQLEDAVNQVSKTKLKDTVKILGGNLENINEYLIKPGDIGAFLECHIEQGRKLYDRNLSLGVVTKITGIYREQIHIFGESNHAGTTLMHYRKDALLAACELCLDFEQIIKNIDRDDVVGTVGYIEALPNSPNIIVGESSLIVEIRTNKDCILQSIIDKLNKKIDNITYKRKVKILRKNILNQKSVPMDEIVKDAIKSAIKSIEEPFIEIPSMAGHDSAHMAEISRTGMLFTPSINGKSHCPDEKTDMDDIEKAGNVLLKTVLILDKELN
ncbi:MAG: M20 family metallo-hydrolase [Clostridium sp.]|jgi:N-carbamoyl-L-amino-acid hydrolase|uniref:M20 family metallo-hydrolase n=1 Tax=Clostridium sp. TaxID=1506 RepID=UPI0025C1D561|nr:M20 family metallo-hydrolase [Clostridium sp.]MCH3963454.1 M20 family metallo-hydrolase [Clostridium sp.]MCI1716678.1 M20 family metallo-hydrolase [Clostridium sp.]MCI1801138.1 M20 family metallo-hydrolase [Clostridium sp.]MCI1814864.1 M20 family metallo-hydrolase [Clostridium sp.]MCI1871765.1 M20 family metallo-hydrolase [Clostridium sp.]